MAGADTCILVSAISRRDALRWHNIVENILRSAMPSTTTVALVGLTKRPCGRSQTSKNRSLRQPARDRVRGPLWLRRKATGAAVIETHGEL